MSPSEHIRSWAGRSAPRRGLVLAFVVAAAGLTACGGSGGTPTLTVVYEHTPTATTGSTSDPPPQTSTSSASTPAHHNDSSASSATSTTARKVTIPANSASPKYTGPSPLFCLTAVGLNRARAAREPQVWEANEGHTSEQDSNGIVFLSGPYKNAQVAKNYAKSLLVVELAASAGRWVASASLVSHMSVQVNNVAACMVP